MLHLGGSDPEGERTKGPVGRRVAVAADDHHAGLGDPLLGADDMDDPLARVVESVERDAELGAVCDQGVDLPLRQRVAYPELASQGGDPVVDGGQAQVGPSNGATGQPEGIERLRRGDLVHQVEVDEQQVGFARGGPHEMALPHLGEEVLGCGHGVEEGSGGRRAG